MRAEVTVKENRDFRRIYRKGRSAVGPYMVVYCQKNRRGQSRLGITVSAKVGKAVVRNRLRRQIRELYRHFLPAMTPGFDLIVVGRGRAVGAPYRKLLSGYGRLLAELELLEEKP